ARRLRPVTLRLTPNTPRRIPARQRVSDLTLSMTYAAISTALITAGLWACQLLATDMSNIFLFAGTALIGSWGILGISKITEGRRIDGMARRLVQALVGAGVGVAAFGLNDLFYAKMSDPIFNGRDRLSVFYEVGDFLLYEGHSNHYEPTL